MKNRTVRESKTVHDAPHLAYQCPECGGYEMVAELRPVERQHHANSSNHMMLRLRCAKQGCPHAAVVHYGSVEHREQFRIRRFPRSIRRFPRFPHNIVATLGADFARIVLEDEVERAVHELGDMPLAKMRTFEVVLRAVYEKGKKDASKPN